MAQRFRVVDPSGQRSYFLKAELALAMVERVRPVAVLIAPHSIQLLPKGTEAVRTPRGPYIPYTMPASGEIPGLRFEEPPSVDYAHRIQSHFFPNLAPRATVMAIERREALACSCSY